MLRARTVVPIAAGCAGTLAAALGWSGRARITYHDIVTRTAIEVTCLGAGLLVTYLIFGRFRQRATLPDLALAWSTCLLALSQLSFSVIPLLEHTQASAVAPMLGGLTSATGFAIAAWAPERPVRLDRRPLVDLGAVSLVAGAVVALIAFAVWLVPVGGSFAAEGASPDSFGAVHGRVLSIGQFVAAALLLGASVGFARRADRGRDGFLLGLAVACVFSAASRVSFALAGSPTASTVAPGVLLRLAFYVVLVTVSAHAIRGYWRQAAAAAVLEERHRIARDFHDGLAQELAFIATQTRLLADPSHDRRLTAVAAAASRALDESRLAIAALTRPLNEPLDVALAQAVEEVAARTGTPLLLDLQPDLLVTTAIREALLRTACEAVNNASRHGHPRRIYVQLKRTDALRMSVLDDGSGFDVRTVRPPGGFGLTGMRQRIEAVGGTLVVESEPYVGTCVEAYVP